MKNTKYFQQLAPLLHKRGYSPIPIIPGDKKPEWELKTLIPREFSTLNPKLEGWERLRNYDRAVLDYMLEIFPTSGVGVATFNTPVLDIDVDDETTVNEILEEIKSDLDDGVILTRTGRGSRIAIPLKNDGELYGKIQGNKYYDPEIVKRCRTNKKKIPFHQVEVLSNKQQFLVAGIHKDTKKPYGWGNGKVLWEYDKTELPSAGVEPKALMLLEKIHGVMDTKNQWTTDRPTDKSEQKTIVAVPENYSGDSTVGMSAELKHKYTLRRYQLENLEHIHPMIDYREWHYVLMALHKEGEGRAEFYQIGRKWSISAGTDKGYFDKEAQKVLPPEMEKSSKWKSFKGAKGGKQDIDGSYIQYLFNKYCPFSELQQAISGFDVIEFKPPTYEVSGHEVMQFDADKLLPPSLAPFVKDAANRMACSPDFIGVSMVPVLTSIIGGQAIIRVKKHDTSHKVYPTAWCMVIGEPSLLKSPCVQMVMAPLEKAQEEFEADFKQQIAHHKAVKEFHKELSKDKKDEAKEVAKTDRKKAEQMFIEAASPDIEEPNERHSIANDTSVEQMQIMMKENHGAKPFAGMLYFRDELSSHIETLSREDRSNERGFFMQCFNGYGTWRVNRVTREKVVIPNTNISILGTIQPAKIARHVRAMFEGTANDGLFQRYQFAVYPQKVPRQWVDVPVNETALAEYENVINKLLAVDFLIEGKPRVFKFDNDAQKLYQKFYEKMCDEINSETNHPVLKNHLAKMDKTIGTLALIFELVENPDSHNNKISLRSMMLAYNWFDYLKSHAEAIYSVTSHVEEENANLILARKDRLSSEFTEREIVKKRWTGLTTQPDVKIALKELLENGTLIPIKTSQTIKYRWATVRTRTPTSLKAI